MLILFSPSKGMDGESPSPMQQFHQPQYLHHAQQIVNWSKRLTEQELIYALKVSSRIAQVAHRRFHQFSPPFTLDNAKQAIFTYTGEVYEEFQPKNFSEQDIQWIDKKFLIFSPLYGILKPLDLIQVYRVELLSRVNPSGENLNAYWRPIITQEMNRIVEERGEEHVLSLASKEFEANIDRNKRNFQLTQVTFREKINGRYKTLAYTVKKMRGRFAQLIVEKKMQTPKELKEIEFEGYQYCPKLSEPHHMIFCRNQPPRKKKKTTPKPKTKE